MNRSRNKRIDVDTVTIRISHLWAVITTIVALVIGSGTVGFTMSKAQSDLEMRAHVAKDNEERVKDAEIHSKYDLEIEILKAKVERAAWKGTSEEFPEDRAPARPEKERLLILEAPKQ